MILIRAEMMGIAKTESIYPDTDLDKAFQDYETLEDQGWTVQWKHYPNVEEDRYLTFMLEYTLKNVGG